MTMSDKDEPHVSRCTPGHKADAPNEADAAALIDHIARLMALRHIRTGTLTKRQAKGESEIKPPATSTRVDDAGGVARA